MWKLPRFAHTSDTVSACIYPQDEQAIQNNNAIALSFSKFGVELLMQLSGSHNLVTSLFRHNYINFSLGVTH